MAIHPSLRDCIDRLTFTKTKQPADHGSGGNLDKNNVVKSHRIESVRDLEASLNLVSLDDCNKDCTDSQRRRNAGRFGWIATEPVGNCQNGANIVCRNVTAACGNSSLESIPEGWPHSAPVNASL